MTTELLARLLWWAGFALCSSSPSESRTTPMRDPRLLAKPPVTRLGCLVLVRNRRGDVLLVNPDYMDGMILPGGAANTNEPPHRAAAATSTPRPA
ncbi:hypothetical protein [Kitasatospora sp. NPDC056531]|uniref:hypothetical protein n=1 Tax=Kitasatospora sp. NPDC056531 TaxID=3345856 RepID=UPI0036C27C61